MLCFFRQNFSFQVHLEWLFLSFLFTRPPQGLYSGFYSFPRDTQTSSRSDIGSLGLPPEVILRPLQIQIPSLQIVWPGFSCWAETVASQHLGHIIFYKFVASGSGLHFFSQVVESHCNPWFPASSLALIPGLLWSTFSPHYSVGVILLISPAYYRCRVQAFSLSSVCGYTFPLVFVYRDT